MKRTRITLILRIMAKIKDNPIETMRLDIEFADNGIILRNSDCIDEVTLALTLESADGEGKRTDWHEKEYRAIGKKIYDWLTDVVVPDNADRWITTGARLSIKAELEGRAT